MGPIFFITVILVRRNDAHAHYAPRAVLNLKPHLFNTVTDNHPLPQASGDRAQYAIGQVLLPSLYWVWIAFSEKCTTR